METYMVSDTQSVIPWPRLRPALWRHAPRYHTLWDFVRTHPGVWVFGSYPRELFLGSHNYRDIDVCVPPDLLPQAYSLQSTCPHLHITHDMSWTIRPRNVVFDVNLMAITSHGLCLRSGDWSNIVRAAHTRTATLVSGMGRPSVARRVARLTSLGWRVITPHA